MPSLAADFTLKTYRRAVDLPAEVWETFSTHPKNSNIMFPHAKKARQVAGSTGNNLWIVCSTLHSGGVDFVLSCTEGPIGSYPVFIFTPITASRLEAELGFYIPRIRGLVRALQDIVPPERVFSVFALETISRAFASIWTAETGVPLDKDAEYYAAKFTYCTRQSFRPRQQSLLPDVSYHLRLAGEGDIMDAAKLCHGFAAASEPFVLSKEEAVHEATILARSGQLWVHEISMNGQRPEIASIVAVTRSSDTVAAITKVYTNPRWRQRGCAERLTRHVCKHLLQHKDSVVLYVAHNNPAAAKVYDRVGFVGLSSGSAPVEGVENWLELGFERDLVDLGHW